MAFGIARPTLERTSRYIPSTRRFVLRYFLFTPQPSAPFSISASTQARKKNAQGNAVDRRVTLIRYFLSHPLLPRPLRFSRGRFLRHWTIHRAWQLFQSKQRQARERTLERQYNSMRDACEALRLVGEDGLTALPPGEPRPPPGPVDAAVARLRRRSGGSEAESEFVDVNVQAFAHKQTEVGRLYRIAMEKKGVFDNVPIEYARAQTDTPPRAGWNHAWTRPMDLPRRT